MDEPTVPKFGSFRPAKPVTAPEAAKPLSRETHTSHKRPEHKDRRQRRRHGHHHSPSQDISASLSSTAKTPLPQTLPKQADNFVIDVRGDEKNLVYGSNHKYDVPPFHRYGSGYVLGASLELKIDREQGYDKHVVLERWRDSRAKSREKYVFSKVAMERPRLLKLRLETVTNEDEVGEIDFVPLTRPRKRTKTEEMEGASSGSELDERNYRSIYGKKTPTDSPADRELQYATDSEVSGSDAGYTLKINRSMNEKGIELSRNVQQHPEHIDNWLALIDHQDSLLQTEDRQRRITNAEMKSTADIKVHMYEKALENMTRLEDRERLLLGLMTEGGKIWDTKVQSDRWEQISNDNIDSLLLWTSYLNFRKTNFTSFLYEEIKELFLCRIQLLTRAIAKAIPNAIEPLFHQLIYISLRLTLFIRESGYSELAIAIWQGILEMNFFGPKQQSSRGECLGLFQIFWESEVLRIGEDNALGWRRFVEDENSSDVPATVVDEEGDVLDDKRIFESWASAERLRSRASLPARTMDEVVEDDPFRVILFSDIEEYIYILPPQSSELQSLCLDAFLLFFRLPIMAGGPMESRKWSLDPFIRNDFLENDLNLAIPDTVHQEVDESKENTITAIFDQQYSNYATSCDTMFGRESWFRTPKWRDRYAGDNEPVLYTFVRNILKQITHSSSLECTAEFHLAFEHKNEPATIKKTAKAVLKRFPSSLRLYNAYAIIEWPQNREVSQGVFTAALSMSSELEGTLRYSGIVLWHSWIWACIESGDNDAALGLLLSIAEGRPDANLAATPAVLLKSRQSLCYARDFLFSSRAVDYAVLYAECLALLFYLTEKSTAEPRSPAQGDISSALSIFNTFSTVLATHPKSNRTAHELFLQSASRLLLHHFRSGPHRPALLRQHVTGFITLFPQNTIFLAIYAWNERALRVEHRARSILSSTSFTPQNDNITARVFGIRHEIMHGTTHSAKAAFEHAVSAPSCRGSPGIWKYYLKFIFSVPAFQAKANEIWFRALRACPWSKELYLLGFESIPMSSFKEMRSTWRVLGEKQLRVHVDLEDKFEELGDLDEKRGVFPVREKEREKEKEKLRSGYKS